MLELVHQAQECRCHFNLESQESHQFFESGVGAILRNGLPLTVPSDGPVKVGVAAPAAVAPTGLSRDSRWLLLGCSFRRGTASTSTYSGQDCQMTTAVLYVV